MITNINAHKVYWDKNWATRLGSKEIQGNAEKYQIIIDAIRQCEHLKESKILEVGCGPGFVAYGLRKFWPNLDWVGVDISEIAVRSARLNGLNAICSSLEYFTTDEKFDSIWFLDSLEHIIDQDKIVDKLSYLMKDNFTIFGNIPLYSSGHEIGYEHKIDIVVLRKFLRKCGAEHFWHDIYGSHGYPYMIFQSNISRKEKQ